MEYSANKILFSVTPVKLSTKSEFEATGKSQLLIYSHFLKKFLKETFHFSGCWLFIKKWDNEGVVFNNTPPYNFNSPHRGLSPHKYMNIFCPNKILANFQIQSPHYNGGSRNHVCVLHQNWKQSFSKTYSEIEIMWPINSSKDVLSCDSKELFVQRFVKVFCKQPLLIFSMVHSYMDLKVYGLDCMTASGFRVQITGLVVLFKLPSLALKHVPTCIQKP